MYHCSSGQMPALSSQLGPQNFLLENGFTFKGYLLGTLIFLLHAVEQCCMTKLWPLDHLICMTIISFLVTSLG